MSKGVDLLPLRLAYKTADESYASIAIFEFRFQLRSPIAGLRLFGPEVYFDFSLLAEIVAHSLDDFPNERLVLEIVREEDAQLSNLLVCP